METIEIERPEDAPGLMIVSLNRPEKLNPFNAQMYREIQEVCNGLHEDGSVRVVIFTGAGRAFSAGADISRSASTEPPAPPPDGFTQRLRSGNGNRTAELVEGLDQVTIGAVNGLAIGGAVAFLASMDMLVASESAWFSMPEIDTGTPLGLGALPRLVRAMGPARTKELVLSGVRFTSKEALDWGLVNRVYADTEFVEKSRELGRTLASKNGLALALVKSSINAIAQATTPSQLSFADRDFLALARYSREEAARREAAGEA